MKNNDKLPINTRFQLYQQVPSINANLRKIDWLSQEEELVNVLSNLSNNSLEKIKMFAEVELRERDEINLKRSS